MLTETGEARSGWCPSPSGTIYCVKIRANFKTIRADFEKRLDLESIATIC
jgi:hypothetical protein